VKEEDSMTKLKRNMRFKFTWNFKGKRYENGTRYTKRILSGTFFIGGYRWGWSDL